MSNQLQITGTKGTYLIYEQVLGKGAYGVVCLAQDAFSNMQYAAKIISKKTLSTQDIINLRNEINIQTQLLHQNIVQMVDAFEDDQFLYMILEYCDSSCLFSRLQKEGPMSEDIAFGYFQQILEGVLFIHSKNILHRDIKLSNLLLTNSGQVKLADFTWSTPTNKGYVAPQICGTLEYMPPEVLKNGFQNEKLDIWSLGIVLYELLHNDYPKQGFNNMRNDISLECKQLIFSMLETESFKRPSVTTIKLGSWFRKYQTLDQKFSRIQGGRVQTVYITTDKQLKLFSSPQRGCMDSPFRSPRTCERTLSTISPLQSMTSFESIQ